MESNLTFTDTIGSDKSGFTKDRNFGSTIEKVLNEFGEKLVEALVLNLDKDKKNASGNLQSSIRFDVIEGTAKWTFQLSLLDYYKWVDEGRKPGKFPPITAIESWLRLPNVVNKIGLSYPVQKPYKSGKAVLKGGLPKVSVSKESQLKSLAFLIARKISRKGIKASNFYSDVVNDNNLKNLQIAIRKALRRDVLIQISNRE